MRLFCLALSVVAAWPVSAQLDELRKPRQSSMAHYSSFDANRRNEDSRRIEPGATLTLVDHQGAGVVRRWWLTIAPRNHTALQRGLIIRAYWDDESQPSVEVPLSDFFGMGFGEWRDYVSLPLNMTSGGYNCYWPMPFRKRARITVENRSPVAVDRLYYNIDIETGSATAEDLYFHAQFRRATAEAGKPILILDAEGLGHYAGTVMSTQPRIGRTLWYLEGNERIFVDGSDSPSIIGTGTEDYFSSGWYFDTGAYSAPYHGAPIVEPERGRISAYRWHIEDPIPFRSRLRFSIEHGGTNDTPGTDYATVAYWYQTHPHAPFPPLPADLMPLPLWQPQKIAGVIEAEGLLSTARATAGDIRVQDMSPFETATATWSDAAQLWWVESRRGAEMTLQLEAPAAGTYELIGRFTRASNYGNVRLTLNGRELAPIIEGYGPVVEPVLISFGRQQFRKGGNEIKLTIVGKDDRSQGWSNGYLVGIDGFMLLP